MQAKRGLSACTANYKHACSPSKVKLHSGAWHLCLRAACRDDGPHAWALRGCLAHAIHGDVVEADVFRSLAILEQLPANLHHHARQVTPALGLMALSLTATPCYSTPGVYV